MGRYDRYILSQLLVLFGFFSLVLISVYWINRAVDLFDSLISDGQNLLVFLEFTALSLPQIMLLVLPVAAFVATLYVFNRMISESELVVLQTAGLSPIRLMRPVLVFGVLLCVMIAILANVLSPAAREQFNSRESEVSQDLVGRLLREGQFTFPTTGIAVYIREITELGEFRDVFLQDRRNPNADTSYNAPRAYVVRSETGLRLVMFEGMSQTLSRETQRLSTVEFEEFTFDLTSPQDGAAAGRRQDPRELSTFALIGADQADASALGTSLAVMRWEGHDRIARSLFVIFIPMIGAASLMLGTFSRLGVWPQILLAVILVIPLQIGRNALEDIALGDAALALIAYFQPVLAAGIGISVLAIALKKRRKRDDLGAPAEVSA